MAASLCFFAPFCFLPLLVSFLSSPLYFLYWLCFLSVFQFLFLLSLKAFSLPLSVSFSVSLLSTAFLSFSFFPSPFSLFFHSFLPATHFPSCPSSLPPPSVSFIHHFCSISIEQGARERGSVRRQGSPNFPPGPNLCSEIPCISILFFPVSGMGLSWGFLCHPLFPPGL